MNVSIAPDIMDIENGTYVPVGLYRLGLWECAHCATRDILLCCVSEWYILKGNDALIILMHSAPDLTKCQEMTSFCQWYVPLLYAVHASSAHRWPWCPAVPMDPKAFSHDNTTYILTFRSRMKWKQQETNAGRPFLVCWKCGNAPRHAGACSRGVLLRVHLSLFLRDFCANLLIGFLLVHSESAGLWLWAYVCQLWHCALMPTCHRLLVGHAACECYCARISRFSLGIFALIF